MRSNLSATIRQWDAHQETIMERTSNADRSHLIRTSMLLFALLAIASFTLAIAA
ncbi:MAG TPA: hypothetical protein PK760_07355 [Flavobacteriales bacterium]|nr:hypothetical protein [Flavobacteriales bacterium]